MLDNLNSRRVKVSTLHRYSYSIRHFFDFLSIKKIDIKHFGELTNQLIETFIMHLLSTMDKPNTRILMMASLKAIIQHGQRLEYENYPIKNIFDGEEFKVLQTEDVLKTQYIPDSVFSQIENALTIEEEEYSDLMLVNLVRILMDTGMRLGEALNLKASDMVEDFMGKPILYVESSKTDSARPIPVSERVRTAFKRQVEQSELLRIDLQDERIFCLCTQVMVRNHLKKFVKRHNISHQGKLYPLKPHAFRHTLGMKMLNSGLTFLEVQNHLGHESSHSTALYAKVVNAQVTKEMKKAGIIGVIVNEISNQTLGEKVNLDAESLKSAALPDGICKKPINNEGMSCKKYNMCLFCPKFITTPGFLSVHKDHLQRIRKDKESYMQENYIGTQFHLNQVEETLLEIINQLEDIQVGKE